MSSIPFSLIVSWALFSAFVNEHSRAYKSFRGSSSKAHSLFGLSSIFGFITGAALLGYYWHITSWCWPLALIAITLILGSWATVSLFAFLEKTLGDKGALFIRLSGFIAWPICAFWSYKIIQDIPIKIFLNS